MGLLVVESDDPGLRFASPWAIESRPGGAALFDRGKKAGYKIKVATASRLAAQALPAVFIIPPV